MFGTQNLAVAALPCGYMYHTNCVYLYHSYCGFSYCPYFYNTNHCQYYISYLPQVQQAVQCPGAPPYRPRLGPAIPWKLCVRCDSNSR